MSEDLDLHVWEDVIDDPRDIEVRRLRVPGGWLYQVAIQWHHDTGSVARWSHPVYVPDDKRIALTPIGTGA